jgi:hypothetical protein
MHEYLENMLWDGNFEQCCVQALIRRSYISRVSKIRLSYYCLLE